MATPRPTERPQNPDNPLAEYLEQFREEDPPRWLYERARLRKALGISRAHFQRLVKGFGCSLDVALHLHDLTDGGIAAKRMCPNQPWDRLDQHYGADQTN